MKSCVCNACKRVSLHQPMYWFTHLKSKLLCERNISSTQPNLEKNWSNKWSRFTWSLWNSHQFKWKNLSNLHMSWVIMMRKKYDSKYNTSLQRIIIMKPLAFITQCHDMWKYKIKLKIKLSSIGKHM